MSGKEKIAKALLRFRIHRAIAMMLLVIPVLAGSACGTGADNSVKLKDRQRIYEALSDQKLIDPYRQLVRLVHVCSLVVEDKTYPVIDLRELVRGAQVPRGILQVLILDSSLKFVNKIDYDPGADPLFCKGNSLYWYGYVMVDGFPDEGNVVTFSEGARVMKVTEMESNDYLPQKPPQ